MNTILGIPPRIPESMESHAVHPHLCCSTRPQEILQQNPNSFTKFHHVPPLLPGHSSMGGGAACRWSFPMGVYWGIPNSWMVDRGTSHENRWFGGSPILGHLHLGIQFGWHEYMWKMFDCLFWTGRPTKKDMVQQTNSWTNNYESGGTLDARRGLHIRK